MRFEPFRQLERLTHQTLGHGAQLLAMDAYRQGDRLVVRFDLPGVDPDSIDLTVEKNVLTVRAVRALDGRDDREWLVTERPHGSVSRQVLLGETLATDQIAAGYEAGVLTLTIPVAEQAKPRKVEVTTGGGRAGAVEARSSAA